MGGAKDWPEHERFDLCRECHEDLHAKKWTFRVEGAIVVGFQPDDPKWITFRRGLVLSEDGPDPEHWTDEKLATEWEKGEENALEGLRRQCLVAAAFYQRYGWGEKWAEQAARFITDFTGRHVYWRRLYEWLRIYTVFGDSEEHPAGRWNDLDFLGATLALAVAESGDPKKALEMAKEERAEVPHISVRAIKAHLKGQTIADDSKETCEAHEWRCRKCGVEKGD